MGARANLLIANEHGYRMFYSHWAAETLPADLFWGPEVAVAFIERQRPGDQDDWMDEIWAEGGAVVDTARRVLLLFGGDELLWYPTLRRVYFGLLQHTWPGWELRWANRGIVDIAAYVGVPRAEVLSDPWEPKLATGFVLRRRGWSATVFSVRFEDGRLAFYVPSHAPFINAGGFLLVGERLLDWIRAVPGLPSLSWGDPEDGFPNPEASQVFPDSGIHIDLPARQIACWRAKTLARADDLLAGWPGWQLRWLGDRYEEHLALTEGKLRLPIPSEEQRLEALSAMVLREHHEGGLQALLAVAAQQRAEGYQVHINPHAFDGQPLDLPPVIRRQIFAAAVAAYRAEGPSPNGLRRHPITE